MKDEATEFASLVTVLLMEAMFVFDVVKPACRLTMLVLAVLTLPVVVTEAVL